MSLKSYFFNRRHPSHYWRWIKAAWGVSVIGGVALGVAINIGLDVITAANILPIFIALTVFPLLAHLYGFFANLSALWQGDNSGRCAPAVVMVSYLLAGILSAIFIDIELAFTLGFAAVIMAAMSFGVIITGFTPLFGMWLVVMLLTPTVDSSPTIDKRSIVIAIAAMTSSWLIGIMTGYAFGNII